MRKIVQPWILEVKLDGEWEAATYTLRSDAEEALNHLISDYGARVGRAVLTPDESGARYVPSVGTDNVNSEF